MGYAVTMFGVLLIMSAVMMTTYNYGIAKDSQTAPLQAKNDYAARETGKAQTVLTVVQTCIYPLDAAKDRYVTGFTNNKEKSGPYSFNLTVRNNGSIVLNSSKPTVIYISRNTSNKTVIYNSSYVGFPKTPRNVWAPQTNASLNVSGVTINTPYDWDFHMGTAPFGIELIDLFANPWDELRILVAAENGITVIPPTSPINFTGVEGWSGVNCCVNVTFRWNASYSANGIAFYRLYLFTTATTGHCPPTPYAIIQIPANSTSYFLANPICEPVAYVTAVDKLGNEGVPSRALDCDQGGPYHEVLCQNK
ncbi:MAG: hypothetical protein O8C68_11260 [Candidatus Methanoperedens sp.]|nr:hypothetical protein [Candidatus Methanoperedens sp.]